MIAATATSTSAETSRFMASNAVKRSSKSASEWVSLIAKSPPSTRVDGAGTGVPCGTRIGQARFDALDLEADGGLAGKNKIYRACRRFAR
jgi:hypothetical protein